ncbi:MAG TPA: GNAT family N-acetyltransferase [Anaerolineales bacterium]|nr:GNAT family N-acetyltransferase [Anaerolineales bacterium]
MDQTVSLQQVFCRPAVEDDLAEISEFCKTIWNGHDYVPEVMEEWFHDPEGIFAVAEYEGHAIACSKVTLLAEGQWWLEGFRVDPQYQGLKVGSLIHHYVDQWWSDNGDGVLRLMTNAKNKSVHHLCESTNFRKIFEVRGYKAEPLDEPVDIFVSAASSEKDLGNVIEFARSSPSLAITNCVVDFGWRCVNPTDKGTLLSLFSDHSSLENNLFWWRKDKGLLIVWDDFEDKKESTMGIGVLACELEDISVFLLDARRLAAKQGRTSVFWVAPEHEQIALALKQAGYSSDWDHTAFVFEKKHPRGP